MYAKNLRLYHATLYMVHILILINNHKFSSLAEVKFNNGNIKWNLKENIMMLFKCNIRPVSTSSELCRVGYHLFLHTKPWIPGGEKSIFMVVINYYNMTVWHFGPCVTFWPCLCEISARLVWHFGPLVRNEGKRASPYPHIKHWRRL